MKNEMRQAEENEKDGHMCRRQRGQSMTEYVIVCAAISVALGIFMANDSLYREFARAIAQAYEKFSYAISLVH